MIQVDDSYRTVIKQVSCNEKQIYYDRRNESDLMENSENA